MTTPTRNVLTPRKPPRLLLSLKTPPPPHVPVQVELTARCTQVTVIYTLDTADSHAGARSPHPPTAPRGRDSYGDQA